MMPDSKKLLGAKILIAEDEPVIREMMQEELESHGARVSAVTGGGHALKLFNQNPFDIIISDVRMPQGDGIELMTQIQATIADPNYSGPNLNSKLFLCSAYGEQAVLAVHELRLTGILAKPFTWDELINTLAEAWQRNAA
jgi:CheY-like chemotaxis protein